MNRSIHGAPILLALLFTAASLEAQSGDDQFRLFGHLSQAAGISSEVPVHGVPIDAATTDIRTLALQVRYGVGEAGEAIVQLKHQRLGVSPIQTLEDDLEVQWAYYQHRAGSIRVRVGRTPVPFGLFNEMRDVGTLLPFYRVPHNLYPEGTDALDGIVGSYTVGSSLGWNARLEAGAGVTGFRGAFYTPNPDRPVVLLDLQTRYTVSGQLWVGTPIPGLSVGTGLLTLGFKDIPPDSRDYATVLNGSVDGAFDRWLLRSEISFLDLPWYDTRTFMGQAGFWITPRVGLFGQTEIVDFESEQPVPNERRLSEDYALAVNFRVSPSLVLKVEGHQMRGYSFERWIDPSGPAAESKYALASLAVSF